MKFNVWGVHKNLYSQFNLYAYQYHVIKNSLYVTKYIVLTEIFDLQLA
jgi:hypothetical protein